ncbi:MAG: hypothetical protein KJ060_20930, partial [Candidatus Hydrogenedentes bacterium]|nr:hypothetical protein [Candidatus Hydrogenedentota bacterium]
HIHGEGVMVATDLAGNSTEDITAFLTDPLHIWWIIDVHSEIFPDLPDGFATKRPYFTMELDRSFNPQPAGGPPPIFTYRIYGSPDFCGPYEARSPWRPWSPNKSIDDIPNFVTEGEWVLLVVIGADEAGNVEEWPLPGSPVDGPIDLCTATPIPGARNWKRFLFTGFDAPETVIDPTFWHDVNANNNIDNEPNFGSSRLIPLPDDIGIPVRAEFLVSAIRPPGQSAPIRIQWQLIEDGVLADQFIDATTTPGSFDLGVYTANGQVRRITAPVDIATLTGQPGLGDVPLRQRPVTYVYRAAAYFDDNLDTTPDPTDNNGVFDPSAGEIMDPTPANVYFTVVPTGVSNYIKAPTDDDSQPIKEQEIR